jgi:hypothetical protein
MRPSAAANSLSAFSGEFTDPSLVRTQYRGVAVLLDFNTYAVSGLEFFEKASGSECVMGWAAHGPRCQIPRHQLRRLHIACRQFLAGAPLSAKMLIFLALPTGVEPVFSDEKRTKLQ